jgi:serine/threonine protein kinase
MGPRPQLNWVDPMKLTGQRRVAYLRKALAEARGNAVGIDQLLFFDLEGEVGKGAFGAVRLATHVLTGEKVVLKTIEKYKVAALLRSQGVTGDLDVACLNEAQMLAALDHPHVLRLHQV